MKILMINGSPHKNGCTAAGLQEMEGVFRAAGLEVETLCIGTEAVHGCIGCHSCDQTGRCVFNDIVNVAIEKSYEADGFVFASSVHYASLSGSMTSFMDRFLYTGSEKLANKPAACFVSARRAGTTAALDQLLKYPCYAEMPVVTSHYWPMVHGFTAEDVRRDREGTQILRQMARNMVWLLKSIEAGKAAGVPLPEHEERVFTHFHTDV